MRPLKITCQITTKQISNLVRTEKDGRVRQRLRAMKFISQGQTIPQVARRMDISERPLRKWIHRFNKEGPKGNGTVMPKSLSRHELEATCFSELPG